MTMQLTAPQLTTFKDAIQADSAAMAFVAAGDVGAAALLFDAPGAKVVWRTSITKAEIYSNGFTWAQIDNVTDPRWRIWVELFDNEDRSMNPGKANVRAGIAEVWTGTAQKEAVRDYVLGKCKRTASRFESLFATGTGTTQTPADLGVGADGAVLEGAVPFQLVLQALATG